MKYNCNDKPQSLLVNFYKVDCGWLYFKIKLGKQEFKGYFSEAFDPLLNFKSWLEAISIGVHQCSFSYDPEGMDIKFNFNNLICFRDVLTISEDCTSGRVFIYGNVKRKQIVKAFYSGLLHFYNSDKFKSEEWEIEFIKERLCKILAVTESELVNNLSELSKIELGEILFNIDPSYSISFPKAKDKNEEFNLFLNEISSNKQSDTHERVETPDIWKIPEDYDYWQNSRKREFVIKCINEKTNGYSGTKINDFRSEIIESYIDKSTD